MLLVFLAPALVLGRGRRYVCDFVPFALLIFAYAECRGLAHVIAPHPFYRPQIWLERAREDAPSRCAFVHRPGEPSALPRRARHLAHWDDFDLLASVLGA